MAVHLYHYATDVVMDVRVLLLCSYAEHILAMTLLPVGCSPWLGTLRVSTLEERVSRLQREKESVSEQLSQVVVRQTAVEEEKDSLQEKMGQLEGQLRDTQATVEARE